MKKADCNMEWLFEQYITPEWNKAFQQIISGLLFNCPASVVKSISTDKKTKSGKKKREVVYKPVSASGNSFRSRGIKGNLLTTVLAEIRRPLIINKAFYSINSDDSVPDKTEEILKASALADPEFDFIVYQKVNNVSEAETIYYCIRNAFAHGSFRFKKTSKGIVYYLESGKDGVIKSRMRLREKSLLYLVQLSKKSSSEWKKQQRHKK